MIKQYNGFKAEKALTDTALPAGGYIGKIIGAKVEEYTWGSKLVIEFDVAEGEYKGHFDKVFKASTNDNPKWKGTYRVNIPNESDQYFENQKKTFNSMIWAIEESNTGYRWNWDEATLKGKMVGLLYRNFEWEIDDKCGWSTECAWFTSVEEIKSGNFKIPADRPLNDKSAAKSKVVESESPLDMDNLPF